MKSNKHFETNARRRELRPNNQHVDSERYHQIQTFKNSTLHLTATLSQDQRITQNRNTLMIELESFKQRAIAEIMMKFFQIDVC
jgi:hypothetical protein